MLKASREMGFGENWKAALERVKTLHVAPGEQTEVVRALAFEAIEFIESRNLVTIPPLARDDWRIEMLSPEAQRVSPFFLGGDVIQVAFPTDSMAHEDKLMSMRGNNIHFSRATVHHELIPGHHLQGYMTARYNPHRRAFSTPFWTEGWALWWEMLLWDQGFPRGAEDRVGQAAEQPGEGAGLHPGQVHQVVRRGRSGQQQRQGHEQGQDGQGPGGATVQG